MVGLSQSGAAQIAVAAGPFVHSEHSGPPGLPCSHETHCRHPCLSVQVCSRCSGSMTGIWLFLPAHTIFVSMSPAYSLRFPNSSTGKSAGRLPQGWTNALHFGQSDPLGVAWSRQGSRHSCAQSSQRKKRYPGMSLRIGLLTPDYPSCVSRNRAERAGPRYWRVDATACRTPRLADLCTTLG